MMNTLLQMIRTIILWPIAAITFVGIGIVEFAAYFLDGVFKTQFRKPRYTVEMLTYQVATELPQRATYPQLLEFLDKHQFDHGKLYDSPTATNEKHVVIWLRNIERALLSRKDIRLMFFFDKEGHLVNYRIESLDETKC